MKEETKLRIAEWGNRHPWLFEIMAGAWEAVMVFFWATVAYLLWAGHNVDIYLACGFAGALIWIVIRYFMKRLADLDSAFDNLMDERAARSGWDPDDWKAAKQAIKDGKI